MNSQNISQIARKNSRKLNRDQRLQVLTLYESGKTNREISDILGFTIHQIKYTIRLGCVEPGKSTGRKPRISPQQEDELEKFVCSSRETRQMTYLELAMNFPQWNVGEHAIRNALKRRGYCRRIASDAPHLSHQHRTA